MTASLAHRLAAASSFVDAAITVLRGGADGDDGRARALLADLTYLRARILERYKEEITLPPLSRSRVEPAGSASAAGASAADASMARNA